MISRVCLAISHIFTPPENLLISLERIKSRGSPRFDIKLNDQKLANRHWPSCAPDSSKGPISNPASFDEFCIELDESAAQEANGDFRVFNPAI